MRSIQRLRIALLPAALLLASSCSGPTQQAAPVASPTAATPAPFAGELGMGIGYLQTRANDLVDAVGDLLTAVEGQNLALAQRAYYDARAPYEEIEIVARGFPDIHRNIDARAYEFTAGELDPDFRGFHRIEIFLFGRRRTQPALKYAKYLLEDVEELQAALAERDRFEPEDSFAGMIDRCADIATRTITSEEETWSDQTLLVIKHAWIGIHSQYRPFGPKVRAKNAQLAERVDRSYRQAMELIAADFPMGQAAGAPYTLVDLQKRRAIADASMKLRMYIEAAQKTLGLDLPMD